MFNALHISATGMQAQQLHVDTIANNLANVRTTGFKRARVGFADLMVQDAARAMASAQGADGSVAPNAVGLGAGVSVGHAAKMFDDGEAIRTDAPFDVTVRGEGFLEVLLPDGGRAYSRGGTLRINRDGQLAVAAGHPLKPGIAVPPDMQSLRVETDGRVQALVAGRAEPVDIGQLELVRFVSPQGLAPMGDGLYRSSDASGEAVLVRPDEAGAGRLAQGVLEGSNVRMVDEMVQLVVAQRTYEANVKVVQAADEMLGLVNGLRR